MILLCMNPVSGFWDWYLPRQKCRGTAKIFFRNLRVERGSFRQVFTTNPNENLQRFIQKRQCMCTEKGRIPCMHTCRMNYRETFLKLTDSPPRSDVGNFWKEGKEIFKFIHTVHTHIHTRRKTIKTSERYKPRVCKVGTFIIRLKLPPILARNPPHAIFCKDHLRMAPDARINF